MMAGSHIFHPSLMYEEKGSSTYLNPIKSLRSHSILSLHVTLNTPKSGPAKKHHMITACETDGIRTEAKHF